MLVRPFGRTLILLASAIAAVLVLGYAALYFAGRLAEPQTEASVPLSEPSEEALRPSLDCAFHNFTHTAAVVSFYFDVAAAEGEAPRFYERAVIAADGTRKDFAGDRRPIWSYGLDADGKPAITSPDGSTRIVLYGLKPGAAGVFSVEAGIRSNEYRNLGGECRQANLGGFRR